MFFIKISFHAQINRIFVMQIILYAIATSLILFKIDLKRKLSASAFFFKRLWPRTAAVYLCLRDCKALAEELQLTLIRDLVKATVSAYIRVGTTFKRSLVDIVVYVSNSRRERRRSFVFSDPRKWRRKIKAYVPKIWLFSKQLHTVFTIAQSNSETRCAAFILGFIWKSYRPTKRCGRG